jgi:hypothetical protein
LQLNEIIRDPDSGELIQRLDVVDPFVAEIAASNPFYAEHYTLPEMREIQQQMDELEAYLRSDPSDEATKIGEAYIYDDSPTMQSWRKGFPRAKALYPLRYPLKETLPDGTKVDRWAFERFAYSLDARGIRTRAVVMRHLITDYARHNLAKGNKELELLSVACGAAVPVFEGLQQIKSELPGIRAHVTAVDLDVDALKFAHQIAPDYGLTEKDFETVVMNIKKGLMYGDTLAEKLPKKPDVVDMLGIFEYFDDESAAILLAKAHQLLGDEGMVVFGNMLNTHPQLQVNQRAVGWPIIKPRSISRIKKIVTMANDLGANINPNNVSRFVTEDGVYAIVRIVKKLEQRETPGSNGHRNIGARVIDFVSRRFGSSSKRNGSIYNGQKPDLTAAA